MFDNKEITKEKVKAILYAVYNEYVNDINDDIEYFEDIFKNIRNIFNFSKLYRLFPLEK